MLDTTTEREILAPFAAFLEPVSEVSPCGEDLEYDPLYMELFTRIVPKEKKLVGGSSGSERLESEFEPVRWTEVERDCRLLLSRSRDIRLLIVLMRCRVQQGRSRGLLEGLTLLRRMLEIWPSDLYPVLEYGGELDPLPRADALSALGEQQGIVAEIRRLPLTLTPGMSLEVREVERSLSVPRPEDAAPQELVQRQLDDLYSRGDAVYVALLRSLDELRAIDTLAQQQLGVHAPSLTVPEELLMRLIPRSVQAEYRESRPVATSWSAAFEEQTDAPCSEHQEELDALAYHSSQSENSNLSNVMSNVMADVMGGAMAGTMPGRMSSTSADAMPDTSENPGDEGTVPGTIPAQPGNFKQPGIPQNRPAPRREIMDRWKAREQIRETRLWFEEHEPSSPVSLLLRQAEQLVGKRFSEVATFLPLDLVAKWESDI